MFDGMGLHMLHLKIHNTGEGCCCLTDIPCPKCPSHPEAYVSRITIMEQELEAARLPGTQRYRPVKEE